MRRSLGELGVLDVQNPFLDQLARPDVADPVDVPPIQRGVELRRNPFGQLGEIQVTGQRHQDIKNGMTVPPEWSLSKLPDFATKPAWVSGVLRGKRRTFGNIAGHQVDGQHQSRALRRDRALDQRLDEATVLHHVELEPERHIDGRGDILDRAD